MPRHQMFFLPESRFCIIAGNGELPYIVASAIKSAGHYVSLLLLEEDAHQGLYDEFATERVAYGQIDVALQFLKQQKIEYLIFAGGLKKPDLKSIRVDVKGGMLLARLLKAKLFGDDHLLRIVAEFFEEHGLQVVSPSDILDNIRFEYSDIGTISKESKKEIKLGIKAAKMLGSLDIGQAVIVEDNCVIAVEGIEGTDQLIARSATLRRSRSRSGILVKVIKDNQDRRLDVPCIGPNTIMQLASYNYSGIAIEKDKVILIDPDQIFALAKKHNLFIHFVVC